MKSQNVIIQKVLNDYKKAVEANDEALLLSLYCHDAHLYDCWDDWELRSNDEIKKMINLWFSGLNAERVHLKVDFEDISIDQDERISSLHCLILFAAYDDNNVKLRQIKNRFTFLLKREENQWRIYHQHSSLPISSETGKMILLTK